VFCGRLMAGYQDAAMTLSMHVRLHGKMVPLPDVPVLHVLGLTFAHDVKNIGIWMNPRMGDMHLCAWCVKYLPRDRFYKDNTPEAYDQKCKKCFNESSQRFDENHP